MTTSRSVETLEDVSGVKVRVAGAAMNKAVSALGGVRMQIAGFEMFDALTRGTVDGALHSHMALPALDLDRLLAFGG